MTKHLDQNLNQENNKVKNDKEKIKKTLVGQLTDAFSEAIEKIAEELKKEPKGDKLSETEVEKLIHDQVEKTAGDHLSKKEKNMHEEAIKKIFLEGQLPKDAMGFDEATMNTIYEQGFLDYNAGQYTTANQIFRLLCNLDPYNHEYMFALAASFHRLKDYNKAIATYLQSMLLGNRTPYPPYHLSDCYIQEKMPENALVYLRYAAERCGDDAEHVQLKERCLAIRKKIRNDLRESAKKRSKKNKAA